MKCFKKLVESLYNFDFNENPNKIIYYEDIPQDDKKYYIDKLEMKFNLSKKDINNYLEKIKTKFDCNFKINTYFGEGNKITLIMDNYVIKVRNKKYTDYNLIERLYFYPVDNLERPLAIYVPVETDKSFIYVTKRYNPIIDTNFIKNNILLNLVCCMDNAITNLEILGYYHQSISIENLVFNDNYEFILIGFNNVKSKEKKYEHVFRKSFTNVLQSFK